MCSWTNFSFISYYFMVGYVDTLSIGIQNPHTKMSKKNDPQDGAVWLITKAIAVT